MTPPSDQLDDSEYVYRRIPDLEQFVKPGTDAQPWPYAFRPRDEDKNGLSVARELVVFQRGIPLEVVANRGPGKKTYLAEIVVENVRGLGLDVVPDPTPNDPAHCLIPALNSDHQKDEWGLSMQSRLADLVAAVRGPFDGFAKDSSLSPR
jgi:hypothetical protein